MRCSLVLVAALLTIERLPAQQASGSPSPASARVQAAQKLIASNPKNLDAYNELALAYCRWARDNQNPVLYDQAAAALEQSLKLSPGNYDARKLEATVLLGKHDFANALTLAKELNHKVPDDIAGWGLLVDANLALGNYAEAERDAQWILDLRSGSSLGFAKAAVLRDLFGDPEGAFEFFEESRRRVSPADRDELAWLLTQAARMQLELANLTKAEDFVNQALHIWPDSQSAFVTLTDLRIEQHRLAEAAALLEQRKQAVPSAENLYRWAEALEKNGDIAHSRSAFAEFEKKALADPEPSLSLIYYYANGKINPSQALLLANQRFKVRQDVATLDAYAWALYANGKYLEAQQQLNRALAVGVRNPSYFCHAAQIALATNDQATVAHIRHELQSFPNAACSVKPIAASTLGLR